MAEIGVMVVKAVRIDRDGARSLIKAFAEHVTRANIDVRERVKGSADGAYDVANEFLNRYANLTPEETDKQPVIPT